MPVASTGISFAGRQFICHHAKLQPVGRPDVVVLKNDVSKILKTLTMFVP